jgi:hypothetical protein
MMTFSRGLLKGTGTFAFFLLDFAFCFTLAGLFPATAQKRMLPDRVLPKRSSQIGNEFGINSDMPRDPYLPWNRW